MTVVTLDAAGRVPLSPEIMEVLGLRPGSAVQLEIQDGKLVLANVSPAVAPFQPESAVRTAINRKSLATPMAFIKGVGPKMAELLARKGIVTVEDALYYLPARYEDRRRLRTIAELRPGIADVFHAEVRAVDSVTTKGGRRLFEVLVGDSSGTVVFKWFQGNARYLKGIWQPGRQGIFTGEPVQYGSRLEMHHPEVEWLKPGTDLASVLATDPVNYGRTVPVYPLTDGLQQKTLRKLLKVVVDNHANAVTSHVPRPLAERCALVHVTEALREVHLPGNEADVDLLNDWATPAHRTLVFDELFFLQLGLALKRQGVSLEAGISFQVTHKYTRQLLKLLPFALTTAQKRVLGEIKDDMTKPHPMHRLVQGDVGSGKTIIALLAALLAVENDCQVAIMAPTELLAEQHYLNIHRLCEQVGISVALLTAAIRGAARTEILQAIAAGAVQIVIGTHAVIQDKVEFSRLGLGIIDEQHRFGVLQRGLLKKKGPSPHILVMTATPIPRTLAMTVFGDLSLSVVDELPPGRTPVVTKVCVESRRASVYQLVRQEARSGRQAYLICPLVEESAKTDLKAASQMAVHLGQDVFPDLRVGLLHGRLKPEEKEAVMCSFKNRELDILVATTVIEVGIDVPNATVMVIEHAERFGLSQLHQLRGRVGRGAAQSHCILLTGGNVTADAARRLQVMEETSDGFRIAEADLHLRGPGDVLGTRQAGIPEFRVASILRDGMVLEEARREAFALVARDPHLSLSEHAGLLDELLHRWQGRLELAGIA
jgi:ATP-dependent DNA helicase RecG